MTEKAKPKGGQGRQRGSKNRAKSVAPPPDAPLTGGRPSIYSDELVTELCNRMIGGMSLRKVCLMDDMPNMSTVLRWLAEEGKTFFQGQYARAKEIQAEAMAEDILEIADDGRNDTYIGDDGNPRTDHDVIARSRLRVDTRKWLMSKMAPKRYSDRVQQEVSGPGGGPIEFTTITRRIIKPGDKPK